MPVTSWNVSTGAAPLTPARPSTLQPGNNHIDWLFKEGRKMFWLQLSKRRVPEGILTGCAKQAAVAAVHPEQRLVPLVCACSFGSVTPPPPPKPSALQSKKASCLPGAPVRSVVYLARRRSSAWVTVPPFGEHDALQPHESYACQPLNSDEIKELPLRPSWDMQKKAEEEKSALTQIHQASSAPCLSG